MAVGNGPSQRFALTGIFGPTYACQVTIRRALDWSDAATVRTYDGRVLRMRLVIGWEKPRTDWLHDAATAGGGSIFELALIGAGLLRESVWALRYRLQKRRDWWLVKQVDDDEPVAVLHPDRGSATDEAERELQAAVAAGGRYLPYGE